MISPVIVRTATEEDIPSVFSLIYELAVYEKAPEEVTNSPEKIRKEAFGANPACRILVAETAGKVVGTAIYYLSYSTWKGRSFYLDDIVITEQMRGKGIGKMLFDGLVKDALKEDVAKVHWQVLDWNKPAIHFYEKINAAMDGDWINCKLEGESLSKYRFN